VEPEAIRGGEEWRLAPVRLVAVVNCGVGVGHRDEQRGRRGASKRVARWCFHERASDAESCRREVEKWRSRRRRGSLWVRVARVGAGEKELAAPALLAADAGGADDARGKQKGT